MKRLRAVFFGTPQFAVPPLLATARICELVGVVSRPDALVGRRQTPTPSPVKQRALELGVDVHTPSTLRNEAALRWLRDRRPDVAVLAAYGKIVPATLLTIPVFGFLNVHPSLLPRHRGPSPVASAILAGDETTGVTIMLMDELLDHGPIINQRATTILTNETRHELESRLSILGSDLLAESLPEYCEGTLPATPQNHQDATSTMMLSRSDGLIDWHESATRIDRLVRGLSSWPGTRTIFAGETVGIVTGRIDNGQGTNDQPGRISSVDRDGIVVACGQGAYRLTTVHPADRQAMPAADFARGRRLSAGATFN